ncbi:glycoside hydrolase family 3 C-terminal domain-containing protein [Nocardioides fonticola]|uniref:Glycoside hydrolase family 3 C-terminal domain-containing protein n=1 Tax=Nocardioides fonticola TaxID=450363 RepID=A0ABP7XJN9_9ACTN
MATPQPADLTLEEKASLTSGSSFWLTEPIERVDVPAIMLTDGPHGLRKQEEGADHLGLSQSVPATCFPPAVALGSSWDTELAERVGAAIAREAAAHGVSVVLGPGINIKRSLLCGRNFEYVSEDPHVSGRVGAALVRGLQSEGIGSSLKHFAANNQEHDRMRVSSDVDPRPLREIYLRAFEHVVRTAQPWTVMCSYNRINGVYASEDPWLLTEVLREEWGFEGLVVSDWGAVNDRVRGLAAGLDLEMPSSGGRTDAQIVRAVRAGELDEGVLDQAAGRVLRLIDRATASQEGRAASGAGVDVDAHHALAREAAGSCVVLLQNDGDLLPLDRSASIAVIGEFARTPRFQGAGSSVINPTRLDAALDSIVATAAGDVAYAPGFSIDPAATEAEQATLAAEAVELAARSQVAVLFLGLPGPLESEGFDRTDIDLPAEQVRLVDAVRAVNPRVVVVLANGGVVALPFAADVPAILEGWLLGQAGGGAVADVLFGDVTPSGKLTETIPLRLEDSPAYLDFPGDFSHVRYGEGLFVGYRWYDARSIRVAFPFGHGLSYTTFAYGDLTAQAVEVPGEGGIEVSLDVTNTGSRRGREVVQFYVAVPESGVQRPVRELAGFAAVTLDPGETRTVTTRLERADLAYWDVRVGRWVLEPGRYVVEAGASSRDLRSRARVDLAGEEVVIALTPESSLGEALRHPSAGPVMRAALTQMLAAPGEETLSEDAEEVLRMIDSLPLNRLGVFAGGADIGPFLETILAAAEA